MSVFKNSVGYKVVSVSLTTESAEYYLVAEPGKYFVHNSLKASTSAFFGQRIALL
jgi:hypothetical protein